jgi:hypothetical protein
MATRTLTFRQAQLVVIGAVITVLLCSALGVAAILVPAPGVAVPAIVLACVGCPVFTAWELPAAIRALSKRRRSEAEAVAALRTTLARLPETEHPLGF